MLLSAPFYNHNSGSERLCDTPKGVKLASGGARIRTQAEWGYARDHAALVISKGPHRSGAGCTGGDGDRVAFMLMATLSLALRVHHSTGVCC